MEIRTGSTTNIPLKSFSVFGLHGDRDISIEFKSSTRIIIATNGAGKTSIINLLYHFLSCSFSKLAQYEFEYLEAVFGNGSVVRLAWGDLDTEIPLLAQKDLPPSARRLYERLSPDVLSQLIELFRQHKDLESIRRTPLFSQTRISLGIPSIELFRNLTLFNRSLSDGLFGESSSADARKQIEIAFPFEILFLPTYRRVEEDLSNLGLSVEDSASKINLINFGMSDVRRRFDLVLRSISESSLIFYQQMSGRMLDELMKGLNAETLDYKDVSSTDVVAPLLRRFSSSISGSTQQEILALTESGRIKEHQYRPLAYFISRLVEFDRERQKAESYVVKFSEVVNGYLQDKYVDFNNEAMTIRVLSKKSGKDITLDKLSSGEKQLISLFSQIYLSPRQNLAVLFDEPELSLSLDWQQKLLSDILGSNRCSFLLVATHSPFILDEGSEAVTGPMCIKEREVGPQ